MKLLKQTNFGWIGEQEILETTMVNSNGMRVSTCTYGATLTKLIVADRAGVLENIICSFPSVDGYRENAQFFGATIGPFAGRLENAQIRLEEKVYHLTANDSNHLLHGGEQGFHQAIWQVTTAQSESAYTTEYQLCHSGEYPGDIKMKVQYILNDRDELVIKYEGFSNKDTLINCTNHAYFNLSGDLKRTVHAHQLTIPAYFYMPLNDAGLPNGDYAEVAQTLFDFNQGGKLATVIDSSLKGLDHPYILTGQSISLYDEVSGRKMKIKSEDRALVVYTGNKIGEGYAFNEAPAQNYLGVCLEEQNVPNSNIHKHLPSSFIKKNDCYSKETIYQFTIE